MRILIATGGAAHSDEAVRLGLLLTRETGGTATLLTVVKRPSERAQGEAVLTRAAKLGAPLGGRLRTRIREGQVADEIIVEAREGHYQLIIVGERPLHGLRRRLAGPTGERVIAELPCPVLVARTPKPLNGSSGELPRRILVCEGGREPTVLARLLARLQPLVGLAANLTVLHVMSQMTAMPGVPGWELRAEAEQLMARHTREGMMLEDDMDLLQSLDVRPRALVRHGLVVDEIVAEANAGNYDLIVIGPHESHGWQRFLLDDLSHQILDEVGSSVLIV